MPTRENDTVMRRDETNPIKCECCESRSQAGRPFDGIPTIDQLLEFPPRRIRVHSPRWPQRIGDYVSRVKQIVLEAVDE